MTVFRRTPRAVAIALPCLALTACEASENLASDPTPDWHSVFWRALKSHCGNAYAGKLVSDDAADADFADAAMIMHVAECSEDKIAIPFHVELPAKDGAREWDRSRTWLITRTEDGLRLKHDHRHKDGEPDTVTMYGGDTTDKGSAQEQAFAVDDFSIAMFEREGLDASVSNIWSIKVDPVGTDNAEFAYQLKRTKAGGAPENRFFRVQFDLSQEVEVPPPAWGWE